MKSENSTTKRRLRGSYLISLMSIMLVLFVLSLFSSLMLFANRISDYIKENIGFEVVMKKGVKEKDIIDFQHVLDKKEYVKSTEYISKEEATRRLSEDLGKDILEWLGNVENPLLPSIDVRFKSEYANNDSIAKIEQWVLKNKNVKEVYFQKSLIHSIDKNVNKIAALLLLIGFVLLIMAVTLISHTVRLSVYSKRFVVRSMQLVGATEGFIIKPFMKYFVIQGVIGAILSLVLLTLFLVATLKNVPELAVLINFGNVAIIYVSVLVLGVLLTTLSTYFSMRKYLTADIDELYE
ncbi:MAG: permease-like cell division protein FtsX [Bacteroidales bacterium]|nr:permease-like cell division protein FtsX [Bacteroidales bacterium]MBR4837942.1 permease-like cell division protein FtsX [Bacteroidales bacterium]